MHFQQPHTVATNAYSWDKMSPHRAIQSNISTGETIPPLLGYISTYKCSGGSKDLKCSTQFQ